MMRSVGTIRRAMLGALVLTAGAVESFAGKFSGRNYDTIEHDAARVDVGRWSYARKGKRTAAQIKRAARKKRNRQRNK